MLDEIASETKVSLNRGSPICSKVFDAMGLSYSRTEVILPLQNILADHHRQLLEDYKLEINKANATFVDTILEPHNGRIL